MLAAAVESIKFDDVETLTERMNAARAQG